MQASQTTSFRKYHQKWIDTPFRYYQMDEFYSKVGFSASNQNIYNKKSTHFFIFGEIGGAKFPKILLRNATHDDDFFCNLKPKKL